jgi:hypothetical protein
VHTLVPIDKAVLPYPARRAIRRGARPIVSPVSGERYPTTVLLQHSCGPGDRMVSLPCRPGDRMTICWCESNPNVTWPCPCF